MKLLKLSQYVLDEQEKVYNGDQVYQQVGINVSKYAEQLQKIFDLGSFVPTNPEGNYLKEPLKRDYNNVNINNSYFKEYQKAFKKVLFKDFEYEGNNVVRRKDGLYIYLDSLQFMWEHTNGLGGGDIGGNTLEHLALCDLNLELI